MRKWFIILLPILNLVCSCSRPLTFDENGIAHGTGDRIYKYVSGVIKLRESYKDGVLVHSQWFRPDSTVVGETYWKNGCGIGLFLREDGSVKQRMSFVNGFADGETTNFDEAGHATKVMYHSGQPVKLDAATRP